MSDVFRVIESDGNLLVVDVSSTRLRATENAHYSGEDGMFVVDVVALDI